MNLNAQELTRLRAIHSANLGDSCTVWRVTSATTNSAGGPVETRTQVGAYACRLMPEQSRRVMGVGAAREVMLNYYRLTVPWDADLMADDEVRLGGDRYQVINLWDDHSLRTARRAVLEKLS